MGRAHEVRAASMAKTNLAKSKLYSRYGKEIYMEARNGGPDPNSNLGLRRLIEKAKKDQIPADVIKRNIDKAKGGTGENYSSCRYEAFGPSGSTFIIDCLTDNSNRTISALKGAFSKCGCHLGASGSVTYNYDYQAIICFKGIDEETVLDSLLEAGIEVNDIESDEDEVTVLAQPTDAGAVKEALQAIKADIEFSTDEVAWVPKEQITLPNEDLDKVARLFRMLDENDDVSNHYNNISNLPELEE